MVVFVSLAATTNCLLNKALFFKIWVNYGISHLDVKTPLEASSESKHPSDLSSLFFSLPPSPLHGHHHRLHFTPPSLFHASTFPDFSPSPPYSALFHPFSLHSPHRIARSPVCLLRPVILTAFLLLLPCPSVVFPSLSLLIAISLFSSYLDVLVPFLPSLSRPSFSPSSSCLVSSPPCPSPLWSSSFFSTSFSSSCEIHTHHMNKHYFGLNFCILVSSCLFFPSHHSCPFCSTTTSPPPPPPPLSPLLLYDFTLFFLFFPSWTCPCTQQPDYRDQSEPDMKSRPEEIHLSDPPKQDNSQLEQMETEADVLVSHPKAQKH